MSIKYENFTWENFKYENFLTAQTVFAKILLFCKWTSKGKIEQFEKGLFSQNPFAVWFQIPLFCIPFALNFSSILKFVLNKSEDNVKLNIYISWSDTKHYP